MCLALQFCDHHLTYCVFYDRMECREEAQSCECGVDCPVIEESSFSQSQGMTSLGSLVITSVSCVDFGSLKEGRDTLYLDPLGFLDSFQIHRRLKVVMLGIFVPHHLLLA